MRFEYPRSSRLTRKRDIDLVYRKGRRVSAPFLRLHVRDNGLPVSRLALSIPSRVCNAVLRNRWKRMLRESLRLHPGEVGAGLDIIAVPTRPPGDLKRPQVERVFLDLIRRARQELPTPKSQ